MAMAIGVPGMLARWWDGGSGADFGRMSQQWIAEHQGGRY
jgi:hypothetical protein